MAADIGIKQSSRITLGKDGYKVEVAAIVSGVTGTDEERLYNALNDSQLPNYGDVHSTVPDVTLQMIKATPMEDDKVMVVMSYYDDPGTETGSSNATVRSTATTVTEEAKFDINGDSLVTRYTTSTGIVSGELFTAEVERPRVTFDFEYTGTTYPQTDINTYLGRINSAVWNGYAIGTILCTSINVNQQGSDFNIRYSFALNTDTWAFEARTSRVPTAAHPTDPDANLDLTTGKREYVVYNSADFSALGFTL